VTDSLPWTAIRYDDGGWPSHPDEDLPPDGALVELWRFSTAEGEWHFGRGICERILIDGHASAQIISDHYGLQFPPPDMPTDVPPAGVVWRLM
jgi:hypothetical protein